MAVSTSRRKGGVAAAGCGMDERPCKVPFYTILDTAPNGYGVAENAWATLPSSSPCWRVGSIACRACEGECKKIGQESV